MGLHVQQPGVVATDNFRLTAGQRGIGLLESLVRLHGHVHAMLGEQTVLHGDLQRGVGEAGHHRHRDLLAPPGLGR